MLITISSLFKNTHIHIKWQHSRHTAIVMWHLVAVMWPSTTWLSLIPTAPVIPMLEDAVPLGWCAWNWRSPVGREDSMGLTSSVSLFSVSIVEFLQMFKNLNLNFSLQFPRMFLNLNFSFKFPRMFMNLNFSFQFPRKFLNYNFLF